MGFYVEEPDECQTALPDLVGPVLRLGVCTSSTWKAVVLVAYRCNKSSQSNPVTCEWKLEHARGAKWRSCERVALDTHEDSSSAASEAAFEWQLLRFTLPTVPLKEAQILQYRISIKKSVAVSASIPIPALHEEWRVLAYSCYDQRRGVGQRLWKNIAGVPRTSLTLLC